MARARAHPGIEPNSMTPSVYAPACADMMRTARRFNAQDAVFAPFIEWWRALAPPSGVEAHHAAVLEMYIDWREAQIVDLESLAPLRAVQEASRLPAGGNNSWLQISSALRLLTTISTASTGKLRYSPEGGPCALLQATTVHGVSCSSPGEVTTD